MSFTTVEAGSLLIAPPILTDPNFDRAVVLLCDHDENGSFGLVLNRELTLDLNDLVEDVNYSAPVSLGGPVQPNTLHYLHRHGDRVPDAVEIVDGICWGGNFDSIKELLHVGLATTNSIRFFLGYAGWIVGQLQSEIEAGGWIVGPGSVDAVFDEDQSQLWRSVLRRMGGNYAMLANFPADPRLN